MSEKLKILLVGCGKMGSAMLHGFLASGVKAANITVIDPAANPDEFYKLKVNHFPNLDGVEGDFDFCIIAVKPQNFDETLAQYKHLKNCCFISIAAGKTVAGMSEILGVNTPIIRAMPNLPAVIGEGVTAFFANPYVSEDQADLAADLLSTVGHALQISDESQINVITAISGSGPAYVFHIIEIFAKIGQEMGLDKEVALTLAKATVCGSGILSEQSEKSPEQLRIDVTSPKGTTEAALKVLMTDNKLENLFRDAIKAASNRAKELQ